MFNHSEMQGMQKKKKIIMLIRSRVHLFYECVRTWALMDCHCLAKFVDWLGNNKGIQGFFFPFVSFYVFGTFLNILFTPLLGAINIFLCLPLCMGVGADEGGLNSEECFYLCLY